MGISEFAEFAEDITRVRDLHEFVDFVEDITREAIPRCWKPLANEFYLEVPCKWTGTVLSQCAEISMRYGGC